MASSSGPRRNRSKLSVRLLIEFLDGSQRNDAIDHSLVPVAQGHAGLGQEPADSCSIGNEKPQVFRKSGAAPRNAPSVIIRAAHVVAAFFADQFAFATGQSSGADRAIEHRLVAWRLGLGRGF